jgi:hypothetical protein
MLRSQFSAIFYLLASVKKWRYSQNPMIWSNFFTIKHCFEPKTPFFGENILKIMTSVPANVVCFTNRAALLRFNHTYLSFYVFLYNFLPCQCITSIRFMYICTHERIFASLPGSPDFLHTKTYQNFKNVPKNTKGPYVQFTTLPWNIQNGIKIWHLFLFPRSTKMSLNFI